MGCISSSNDDTLAGPVTERSTEIPDQGGVKNRSSNSTTPSGHKTVTNSHQISYDTELAASLVESSKSAVAYHGLLVDAGRLSLKRSAASGDSKLFFKSVHPFDDAYTTESQSDLSHDCVTAVRGIAMTMPYTIIVAAAGAENSVKNAVRGVFDEANRTVNGWNPESEISKLNGTPPGKSMQVSSELLNLFGTIDHIHSLTEGRFDPTTGALNVAFENCIKSNARPPLPSEVKPLKYGIGWRKRLERNEKKITRTNANTVIDLDGISKGFVIDKLITALVEVGYKSCYVDWAGDVRAVGNHPCGRPWRSVVLTPPPLRRMFTHWQNGTLKEMLQSEDIGFFANYSFQSPGDGGAIAASGDYFSIQQYGYHHIASSDDLTVLKASQTSVASVCVAAASCTFADAIATAAMTCKTVEEAVGLLKRIQSSAPDVISGYCVMNRDRSKLCSPEMYTPDVFVCALDTDSSPTETPIMNSIKKPAVDEEVMSSSRKRVTRNIAEVHFNNASIITDSFVPCSMEPEQLVTFVLPANFVSRASVYPENDLNRLAAIMLTFQSEDSDANHNSARVDMRFRKVTEYGKSALIVAAIEAIDLGSMSIIEIPHREGALVRRNMALSVPRSQFGISPLENQTKELFRQIPAVVWILETKSADQVDLAITATSVTVPELLENMLCFNITHSSAFFAGIGGLGSIIRGHVLSFKQKKLADTFVAKSSLNSEALSKLESDSVMAVDCAVELVESVQDHIVVLARINDVRYANGSQFPLLRLQGCYLDI